MPNCSDGGVIASPITRNPFSGGPLFPPLDEDPGVIGDNGVLGVAEIDGDRRYCGVLPLLLRLTPGVAGVNGVLGVAEIDGDRRYCGVLPLLSRLLPPVVGDNGVLGVSGIPGVDGGDGMSSFTLLPTITSTAGIATF